MTIKGTLETFHLLDLLQMLAFNQKVGTLALETAKGPRTVFVQNGTFGFVRSDVLASKGLARVLRRTGAVPADRLERGVSIAGNAGRFLGDALAELGVLDGEKRATAWSGAFRDLFFDLLQTSIAKFEFYEQKVLGPDGNPSEPIVPLFAVDSALLEVTRQGDEWTSLRREIPSDDEVFERTALPPEARGVEGVPDYLPPRVLPLLDGRCSVSGVIEKSDCDRFTVVKYIAGLLREGSIRAMTTDGIVARAEDSLGRGAGTEAVPLLRRALERGDAHPTVRLRYADALAAAGDLPAAAAELDTYAASFEATDPVGVFEALTRALAWRSGDLSTAARVCDHYLRHANVLRARAHDAVAALRLLVNTAAANGRANEAAPRLASFIERGDVPSDERVALSELFASAGRPVEAAQTLVRRGEDLLHAGKAAAAKDAFRRALGFDPTRIDIKRQLTELESIDRRRSHRRRMVLLLLLFGVVIGTAGAVYLVSDSRAACAVDAAVGRAETLARESDAVFTASLATWNRVVDDTAAGHSTDGALEAAASALESEATRISTSLRASLTQASGEVNRHASTNRGDVGIDRMRAIEAAAAAISTRAAEAIRAVDARAQRAIETGEQAFEKGVFREAEPRLREAIRFSFADASRTARAKRLLVQVDDYTARFGAARAPFDAAVAASDTDRAFTLGVGVLKDFLDSDLAREILLPIPVTTLPAGASVRLGSDGPPISTPTTMNYSPFGELELHVRMAGHVPAIVRLPGYRKLREDALAGNVTPIRPTLTLPEGPRWIAPSLAENPGPFVAGEAIWVGSPDARRILVVRAADGATSELRGQAPYQDRLRFAGRSPTNGTWAVIGRRTLVVSPADGPSWQLPTIAPLEKPPAFAVGITAVVDEAGTVYAVDSKGIVIWRATLSAPSAQGLHATSNDNDFVTSATTGEAVAVGVRDGAVRSLTAPTPGRPVLVVPFGDSLLLAGGAVPGLVMRSPAGKSTSLGEATADPSVRPAKDASGVVWLDAEGTVHAHLAGASSGVVVEALGKTTWPPAVKDGVALVVGKDDVLRAVRLDAPTKTLWTCRLPGAARSGPEVLKDAIFVRTAAGLCAFDR